MCQTLLGDGVWAFPFLPLCAEFKNNLAAEAHGQDMSSSVSNPENVD